MPPQAKRRNTAGQKVKSGEVERCCEHILGQEFAELLGQAMKQSREVTENGWINQEVYVVSIHGTRLKITAARFEGEYIAAVNSNNMPAEMIQWVHRTSALDLRGVEDRVEALKWLLGLVRYLDIYTVDRRRLLCYKRFCDGAMLRGLR